MTAANHVPCLGTSVSTIFIAVTIPEDLLSMQKCRQNKGQAVRPCA